jgi:hypothetical protein
VEVEFPEQTQGHELLNPNTATMANQMLSRQPQYYMAPNNPSLHRGPQSLNPNAATMYNLMPDVQSQYPMAPNPAVHRGGQHFSLPPAPRTPPRILPSERPRSQSTIPTSPSSTLSQPANTPRVVFNDNIAYGRNTMGRPQFRPKAQAPQAPFDPTMFYK